MFAGSCFEMGANLLTFKTRFQCIQTKNSNPLIFEYYSQNPKPSIYTSFHGGGGKSFDLVRSNSVSFLLNQVSASYS